MASTKQATQGTPEQYIGEYFTENSDDRKIEFREALARKAEEGQAQAFVAEFARREAQSDQTYPRFWFTVDASELLAYLDDDLGDADVLDAESQPYLAAVAAAAPSVLRARALDALAAGETISAVARAAETSRPTIYKWMRA